MAATIRALLDTGNTKLVLVIAPTNEACKTLVKAMSKQGVTGLRWYTTNSYAATRPEMYEKTTHNMVQNFCDQDPTMDSPQGRRKVERDILKSGRVIICTPDMAQKQDIINIQFDLIVYDKAGIASGTNLAKGLLRYKLDKKPSSHNQA